MSPPPLEATNGVLVPAPGFADVALRPHEQKPPISDAIGSPRAARWSLFYAHALQGLLAAPIEVRSEHEGDQNALAALYADDALRDHDRRFK